MVNRAKTKVPMPEQAPDVRNQNFAEVSRALLKLQT